MDGGVITAAFGDNPTLTSVALGIVILVFIGFLTGLIVPKWTVKSLLEARDERVAQANLRGEDYKKLYETERAASDLSRSQVSELLVTAQATKRIVEAIPIAVNAGSTP